jgi:hypothetical protein
MATVEVWTRNGDKLTVDTSDAEEIRNLEGAPFDDSSNVSRTRVTGDG